MEISDDQKPIVNTKNVTPKETKDPGKSWQGKKVVQRIRSYESKIKKPVKRMSPNGKKKDLTMRELLNFFSDRFNSLDDKLDSQTTKVDAIENKMSSIDETLRINNNRIENLKWKSRTPMTK